MKGKVLAGMAWLLPVAVLAVIVSAVWGGGLTYGRDKLKGSTKTQGDFNLSNRFSLSSNQLAGLTTPVTRATQIAVIGKGPQAMTKLFRNLGGGKVLTGGGGASATAVAAWTTGIVLTPPTMEYGSPPKGVYAVCRIDPASAGQLVGSTSDRRLIELGASSSGVLLKLDFRPPAGGGYMITFALVGPKSPPSIKVLGVTGLLPVVGDQPAPEDSTLWTVLLSIPDPVPGSTHLVLSLPAGQAGAGVLGGVTIRRL
jgi:hypothetical protein